MINRVHISFTGLATTQLNHAVISELPCTYDNEKSLIDKIIAIIALLQNEALGVSLEIALEVSELLKTFDNPKKLLQKELLSRREKEVLRMMSDGLTNKEIGQKLFISFETVKSHRRNILLKTGSKNTAALTKKLKLSDIAELKCINSPFFGIDLAVMKS